jgi:MFS family permease
VPPLPRTVKTLGVVSLLTDMSSEMIYPLLPSFLVGPLKAGPAFVGVIEGIAESVASLTRLFAGRISDRMPRRKPMIVAGYGLSSSMRPLVAMAAAPWHVLAIRTADRIGKGVRGAPRDALLAEVTPAEDLGRAYGFHRAMDHVGAVAGPLIASGLLLWRQDLRLVFALAAVPALASVLVLVLGVREARREIRARATGGARAGPLPPALRRYLFVVAVFTLGNSSDAFLLLRAQQAGVALAMVPLLWAALHVIKSSASTAGGGLSDRFGRRPVITAGWILYALVYAGLAAASRAWQVWALFAVYGLFTALTEGPERALVAELAPAGGRGGAFGAYYAVTGVMLLPASVLMGVLWQSLGAATALCAGAALAVSAALLLWAGDGGGRDAIRPGADNLDEWA